MTRAHLLRPILEMVDHGIIGDDISVGLVTGATVAVFQPGTTTPITDPLFIADSGSTTLSNPFVCVSGVISLYLDNPQRIRLGITPLGGVQSLVEDIDVGFFGTGGGGGSGVFVITQSAGMQLSVGASAPSSPSVNDLWVDSGGTPASAVYGPAIGTNAWLTLYAGDPDLIMFGAITRDSNGAATSAGVIWPDGTTGAYTSTTVSSSFPGEVDAYTITWLGATTRTVTQSAVTRDSTTGAITNRPVMTVS